MRALCVQCGEAIRTDRRSGNYQQAEGWVPLRAEGGANQLSLARRRPRFMCRTCHDALTRGVIPGQAGMFDT